MLIVCPTCASEYAIDPTRIGPAGRKVRCAACRESWLVRPPASSVDEQPLVPIAPEPAIAGPASAGPEPVKAVLTLDHVADPSRAAKPAIRQHAPRRLKRPVKAGPRGAKTTRRPLARAALLVLLAAAPGAVLFRNAVVRAMPGTAVLFGAAGLPVNLVGLSFGSVTSSLSEDAGAPVLLVTGEIANVSGKPREVPAVVITLTGPKGETLYAWSVAPADAELDGAKTTTFRARLASPPPAGRHVEVAFREGARERPVALR